MKKTLVLLLSLLMFFALVSCDDSGECKHSFEVTTAASCSAAGSQTCKKCGAVEEVPVDASAHTYQIDTAATCSAKGKLVCSGCGATSEIAIDHSAHNVNEGVCTLCGVHIGKIFNKTQAVEYDTLAEAIAAAVKDDVILMGKNETVSSQLQIKVPMTLDLCGFTLEGTHAGCTLFVRISGTTIIDGTVAVKNGTIKGASGSKQSTDSLFGFINVEKVVLDDLNIISNVASPSASVALYLNAVRDAQVNNCTIVGKALAYQKGDGVQTVNVTINGGSITTDPNATDNFAIRLCGDAAGIPGTFVVNDATVSGAIEDLANAPVMTINSGIWTVDVSGYVPATSTIKQEGSTWIVTKK